MPEKKNPIEEAKRYLQNAKDLLKEKTTIEGNSYSDSKYVSMAGDTAWKGCLIALDYAFNVREGKKKGTRLSIDDYKAAVSKQDKKILSDVVSGYNILHLYMGYDKEKNVELAKGGFAVAKTIIEKCETRRK